MDHGQCLSDETLTEYLEGVLDPAITTACEVHMIGCDHCREELALYMRVMQLNITPAEDAHINRIADSWDRRKHVSSDTLPAAWGHKNFFLALMTVAVAAVFGVLLFWSSTHKPPEPQSPAEVVQLLLAQGRASELRLDQQPYTPTTRTRGREVSGVDYGLIASEMVYMGADSYAMGRLYLLQKDFARATSELEKAEKQSGASAGVHNDLGVAYLERGGEINIRKAAEEFRYALQINPDFAPAVYNLAIVSERTDALSQAEAQWKRYLELDSTSGWAGEARSRLEKVSR